MDRDVNEMDFGMQLDLSPYVSDKDRILYEKFKDPEATEEYYEKEWYPDKQEEYKSRIEEQKEILKAAGKDTSRFEDAEQKEEPTSLNDLKMTKKFEEIKTPGKEVVEETNTIGLTEDEKNALLSSGAFSGAAAAASSKGKDWKDVLSDAIGGVASGLGTGISPAKIIQERKEQEAKYAAATDMYLKTGEAAHKREMSDDFRIKKMVDDGVLEDDAIARIKLGAPIPKLSPTIKKSIKKGKNPEMAAIVKSGKPYFDEELGMYRVINKETGKEDFVDSIEKVVMLTEQGKIKQEVAHGSKGLLS